MSTKTVGLAIDLAVAGIIGGGVSWMLARKVATTVGVTLLNIGIDISGLVITGIVW